MTLISAKLLVRTASAVSVAILLAGCAAVSEEPVASAPTAEQSEILSRELPPELTAYGVVLAALFIATGDAEEAMANGRVTPAEVFEAKKAIADGTLDIWRERAELELNK